MILRAIAKKITSVTSRIDVPRIRSIKEVLELSIPRVFLIRFTFNRLEIRSPCAINIREIRISRNVCLIVHRINISENLLIQRPNIYEVSEFLDIPEVEQYKNYFLDAPKVSSLKKEHLKLQTKTSQDLNEIINILVRITDQIGLLGKKLSISENLVEAFEESSLKGKKFVKEINRSPARKATNFVGSNANFIPRIRKSYSPTGEPNPLDFLYPILSPPLRFDFPEQFDLYKELHNYQHEGIKFLVESSSALLADEMGTGKTVQAINAARILFRQAKIQSVLIICPLRVVGSAKLSEETGNSEGWDGHLYHWAPELKVTVVRGDRHQRKQDWKFPAHVYITTYETFRDDLDSKIFHEANLEKFDCVILDEAQLIKNRSSARSKAIKKLKPKYRWALTGTPVENSVEDLKSIFEFIRPALFDSKSDYSNDEIQTLIKPYFLRRLKQNILDLPEKIPQDFWLELDEDQKNEYANVLSIGKKELEVTAKTRNEFQVRSHIFTLLGKLKQICNFSSSKLASPKSDLLLEYLDLIIENDQKVIIFSQYLEQGIKKIQRILELKSIKFSIYTGEQSDRQKEKAISDFRNNPDVHVFLATIESGGSGLTLTEASYLIHFDHHWNPAKRRQAEDRAHRIGQKNNLTVYSFWMEGTIEEDIRKKLHEKQKLANTLIDSLAEEDIEGLISTEDWLNIFGINVNQSQVRAKRKVSKPSKVTTEDSEGALIDFAIITAIKAERLAVLKAFEIDEGKDRVRKGSRTYWRKRLLLKDGKFYEIIVAQSSDMANVNAAILTNDTLHHWNPAAVLMVGIAATAKPEPKQYLGDLIIGKEVYYYETGKVIAEGKLPEPKQIPVDSTLLDRVQALPDSDFSIPAERPDGTNKRPEVELGVIASGDKVIADATERDAIASANRKIMAIEMEGYGVISAAWQSFNHVRCLVIRALCDYADSSKHDKWHDYAAATAAGFTKYFLLDEPLDPRNSSTIKQ